jgi:hypothetical protein
MEVETLTVEEVAKYLRVSRQTVYALVRANKIPHFKVGNKVRVKRSDLEAMTNTSTGETK